MIHRDDLIRLWKLHHWRLYLLVPIVLIGWVGEYAFRVEFADPRLGQANVDGGFLVGPDEGLNFVVVSHEGDILHEIDFSNWWDVPIPVWCDVDSVVFTDYFDMDDEPGYSPQQREAVRVDFRDGTVVRRRLGRTSWVWGNRGNVVRVKRVKNRTGKYLKFVDSDGSEFYRLRVGRSESLQHLIALPTHDGKTSVCLCVYGEQDNRYTYRFLNAKMGRVDLEIDSDEFELFQLNSCELVLVRDDEGNRAVVGVTDLSTVLANIPDDHGVPVVVDESRVVTYQGNGYGFTFPYGYVDENEKEFSNLFVHELGTKEVRQIKVPRSKDVVASHHGQVLLLTADNHSILRLDLDSGEYRWLLSLRPHFSLAYRSAVVGLPLFLLLWFMLAFRRRAAVSPTWEVLLVLLVACRVYSSWDIVASGASERILENVVLVCFAGSVWMMLIVAANSRFLFGHGLPLATVGLASLVHLFLFWQPYGEKVEEMTVIVIMASVATVVVLSTRFVLGRFTMLSEVKEDATKWGRITLSNSLMVTTGIAMYFAAVRSAELHFVKNIESSIIVYAIYYSALTVVGFLSAVCCKRMNWAFLLSVSWTAVALVGYEYACATSEWIPLRYGASGIECLQSGDWNNLFSAVSLQPLNATMLLFAVTRYCRAFGWLPEKFRDPLAV